jgi:bacillithiol synthase
LRFRELPGFPALWVDYVEGERSARDFFPWAPDAASLKARSTIAAEPLLPRQVLCDWLQEQSADFGSGPLSLNNIQRLRAPETVAVVAALSPNLFGGPLACWLKAMTAARLAGWITENGPPAVPLVWITPVIPSELRAGILSSRRPRQLAFSSSSPNPLQLPDQISALLSSVSLAAEVNIEDSDLLKILQSTHKPGVPVKQAWAQAVSRLLDFCGLIFFDPSGRSFLPWLQQLSMHLDVPRFSADAWEQRRRLRAAGYHPEDVANPDADDIGGTLSPSLFLPVTAIVIDETDILEDAVSMVAHSGAPSSAPVLWPRASATVLTSKDQRTLDRFNIGIKNVIMGSEYVINYLMQNFNSDVAAGRLLSMERALDFELSVLAELVPAGDRLRSRVMQSRRRMLHQVGKLNRQLQAAQRLAREAMIRQVTDLCHALAPWKGLHERELAGFQFVFRHSRLFPRQLFERLDPWNFEHQLIQL